jgi:hypothetical protein
MSKQIRLVLISGLLWAGLSIACTNSARPTPTQPVENTTLPSSTPALSLQPSGTPVSPQPTRAEPTLSEPTISAPTPVQPSATAPAEVEVAPGVSLALPRGLAKDVRADITPPLASSPDSPIGGGIPATMDLSLNGYPLTAAFHKPHILIYPLAEFARVNSQAQNQISALQDILAKKTQTVDHLPFIPIFNAGQVFHAGLSYLTFQNGSGIRFLTQYDQAVNPVNNQELFYAFQGITSDGAYYVAAILPISDPNLPATGDMTPAEMEKLSKDYAKYMQDTVQMLNTEAPDSFTPNLNTLDNLVMSLKAAPAIKGLSSSSIPPTGLWQPFNNIPSPVYGMSEVDITDTMKETIDIRKDKITYKGQTCSVSGYTIKAQDTVQYFQTKYKVAANLFGLEKTVEVIKTNCTIPGFGEFVRSSADNLIINLDGVFFILNRQ